MEKIQKEGFSSINFCILSLITIQDIPLIDEKGYDPTMVKDLFRAFKENKV